MYSVNNRLTVKSIKYDYDVYNYSSTSFGHWEIWHVELISPKNTTCYVKFSRKIFKSSGAVQRNGLVILAGSLLFKRVHVVRQYF